MKGLLYKELKTVQCDIIVISIIQIMLSLTTIGMAIIEQNKWILFFTSVLCYLVVFIIFNMLTSSFFRNDENKTWYDFATALPQKAKGQVACKYQVILLIDFLILCCCLLTDCIIYAIVGKRIVSVIKVLVLTFCWKIISNAKNIPLMIRFRSASGLISNCVFFVVLLLIIGIYLLFGDLTVLSNGNIKEVIMSIFGSSKVPVFITILFPVTICIYYISYRVSVRIYKSNAEKRDY